MQDFQIWQNIIERAPVSVLTNLSLVSKFHCTIIRNDHIWIPHIIDTMHKIDNALQDCIIKSQECIGHTWVSVNTHARFTFIVDTCNWIKKDYILKQLTSRHFLYFPNQFVCYGLLNQLHVTINRTKVMLDHVLDQHRSVYSNIDFLELKIRRIAYELISMYPCPNNLQKFTVTDQQALDLWNNAFGSQCVAVTFDNFVAHIVNQWQITLVDTNNFINHLSYIFSDKIITTYKWDLLTKLFGPYQNLVECISKYAVRQNSGFLGHINMYKAEEILRKIPNRGQPTLLIRFSRRRPDNVVFTSIDQQGVVKDIRNGGVPIESFIEQHFSGYQIIQAGMSVDEKNVDLNQTHMTRSFYTTYTDFHDHDFTHVHIPPPP